MVSRDYGRLNSTETDNSLRNFQNTCPCREITPIQTQELSALFAQFPSMLCKSAHCHHRILTKDWTKRICLVCFKKNGTEKREIQERHEIENWLLRLKIELILSYLRNSKTLISQNNERKTLWVLKNGHHPKLIAVKCRK